MNLFAARLFGKMVSTEKFEAAMKEQQELVTRYRAVEKSPELKEYLELKEIVESSDFKNRKSTMLSRKYKDTDEGRKMTRYNELLNSARMKNYLSAKADATFQAFLKFRDSEDFAKIRDHEALAKSSELKQYERIYKSEQYRDYLRMADSPELKEFEALEAEVKTEDFQKRNALQSDPKRWEHSDEYRTEARFNELANSEDIKFYINQRKEIIDWAEMFRPTMYDDMSSSKNWKPGFGWANPALKDGCSRTDELQTYNNGANTFFVEGRMDIETHAEPKRAIAWDTKKGFIEHEFEYTSDVMNTREAFSQAEGLFMAKVRSQGIGHHFFGLTTGKMNQPLLALYHYNGRVHQVGLVNGKESKMATLRGMLRSMYYVYTLRWTKEHLIWYVNNLEVLRVANTLTADERFFLAQSFLPAKEKGGEGKLKVQWIRTYNSVEDSALAQRNKKHWLFF